MKRIKKLAAAMLTAIMMMTMTVTAFAAETTHTLTVNANGGQDLNGQTINLYKLFDVTESGTTESKNYAYTVNTQYKAALANVLSIPETSKDEEFAKAVADKTATIQQFANDFTAKALTDNLGVTKTSGKITEENKTSYTFSNLEAGYYLVYVTGGKEIQSSLVTVDATTSKVELKTEGPSISKTADKTTVEIGQVVTYTVKGSIPDTTGYDQYQYIIHDTLSKGLDFVNDANGTALGEGITNVNVTVAFTDADVTDKGTAPTTATLDTANKRKMNLDLSAWVKANQANKGKAFTVTYYAKVNKDAEVTNNNKASLEYGNNPTDTTTTTPSEAKTNTYPLDINKIKTGTKEQLNGATFKLYRNSVESNNVVKVSAVAGKAGCYVVDSNSADTEMATVATNIDGKGYNLHINGLAAGTYYLEETKAPDGFNKLTDPIKVTITKTGDTEWTVSKGEDVETDKIIDVENSTGSLLPSTGGAGVIVFAGVAILLVFGVVVSFIRDKRKAC